MKQKKMPTDVDFRVMLSFLEFYETLLRFVLFKLYHNIGLVYPPKIDAEKEQRGLFLAAFTMESVASQASPLAVSSTVAAGKKKPKKIKISGAPFEEDEDDEDVIMKDGDDEAQAERDATVQAEENEIFGLENDNADEASSRKLFQGLKFFLSREVRGFLLSLQFFETLSKTLSILNFMAKKRSQLSHSSLSSGLVEEKSPLRMKALPILKTKKPSLTRSLTDQASAVCFCRANTYSLNGYMIRSMRSSCYP